MPKISNIILLFSSFIASALFLFNTYLYWVGTLYLGTYWNKFEGYTLPPVLSYSDSLYYGFLIFATSYFKGWLALCMAIAAYIYILVFFYKQKEKRAETVQEDNESNVEEEKSIWDISRIELLEMCGAFLILIIGCLFFLMSILAKPIEKAKEQYNKEAEICLRLKNDNKKKYKGEIILKSKKKIKFYSIVNKYPKSNVICDEMGILVQIREKDFLSDSLYFISTKNK